MRVLFLILFLSALQSAGAPPVGTPPDGTPPDSLRRSQFLARLDSLQQSPFVGSGTVAAHVRSLRTGEPVFDYNARRAVSPASTMKLLTTATALVVLGDTFRYPTTLEHDGFVRRDTLHGNLYVRGTGDPALGSNRFRGFPVYPDLLRTWTAAVQQAGIRVVTGAVIGDGSAFEENATPGTWTWDDLGNYYGAGASGLNVNENSYRVLFRPAAKRFDPAAVLRTEPELPGAQFVNRVRTDQAGTGDQVTIYAGPFDDRIFLDGYVPAGRTEFAVRGSIPDPPYWTAQALDRQLRAAGIALTGTPTTTYRLETPVRTDSLRARTTVLHTQLSPTLRELARECNFQSINLYAEAFLKTVGTRLNFGKTTRAGVDALKQVWRTRGVNRANLRVLDGSGLSPQSKLTAEAMTAVLAAMSKEPTFAAFQLTIPVLGVSGTVKNLGKGTKAAGNVRAKSGSIGGVRAYAGYFTSASGEPMAFAFFLNDYDSDYGSATRELEKLMVAMVGL
jgi:D-alanyl-D-alanine carboxypeptidase/D-alanyl-D-alanine-endopeptidase (penicillin-binding protein 4)